MQVQIRENYSLKRHNTFGIAAAARYFAAFHTVEELTALLRNPLLHQELPVLIVGGGSNLLLTKDFDGIVLKNEIEGIRVSGEDEHHIFITAGGGVNWHHLVQYCVAHNYGGLENLSLIPGSVGAAPMQNIGAYGVEIKDVFHSLKACRIADGSIEDFGLEDCHFGYRESIFKLRLKGKYIITEVTFRLSKNPVFNTSYGAIQNELLKMGVSNLSIAAISQAVINIRTSKLPDWKKLGNAGSFFKNPQVSKAFYQQLKQSFPEVVGFEQEESVKLAAGWLIEQCGWKGARRGDAGCYDKQALVLVNYGNATGAEIFNLSEEILVSVYEKFGVRLEREVNIY